MDQILFYLFAATAALSALLAVTRKNAVAAACWLVIMFFGLAAVYVTLEAYFVAAVQILVYAGAIMVLFLFVIMLLDLRSSELAAHSGPRLRFFGVALAGLFTFAALRALHEASDSPKIADRVTATLRLPAPPSPAIEDPLAVPVAPTPPPPSDVELGEVAPQAQPSELGDAPGEGRGDRAYAGALALGADRRAPLVLTVSPDGTAAVSIDGKTLPTAPFVVADGRSTATYAIPGVPAGASLDVILQRGGLSPRIGGGPDGSPRGIGEGIFEHWLLPFEVASLLLTGAIFGVVVLTKRRLT
jgi:NADH-quinone oxidoreductase subunit J